MYAWQKSWREGIAPQLWTAGLRALQRALKTDDPALRQGVTVDPSEMPETEGKPVSAACAIGFAGWKGDGLQTVTEVEEFFARTVWQATQATGDPLAAKWFVNWHDETPREEMRRELLTEVNRELAERGALEAPPALS
jgi:hypothetical protein